MDGHCLQFSIVTSDSTVLARWMTTRLQRHTATAQKWIHSNWSGVRSRQFDKHTHTHARNRSMKSKFSSNCSGPRRSNRQFALYGQLWTSHILYSESRTTWNVIKIVEWAELSNEWKRLPNELMRQKHSDRCSDNITKQKCSEQVFGKSVTIVLVGTDCIDCPSVRFRDNRVRASPLIWAYGRTACESANISVPTCSVNKSWLWINQLVFRRAHCGHILEALILRAI